MALRPFFGRSIFDEVEDMVDRCFDRRVSGDFMTPSRVGSCPMDLVERPDAYVVKADAPGLDKGDINIEVRGNRLTVSGERKEEKHEEEKGFTRYERSHLGFSRSLQLPRDADADGIEAKLDRGVLSVSIPRKAVEEGSDVKRIEIN